MVLLTGICYGWESPEYADIEIQIINETYGLKAYTDDNSKIVDKETGKHLGDTNSLTVNVDYLSQLEDPMITVSLERRDYSTIFDMDYNYVDLQDYVSDDLEVGVTNNIPIPETDPDNPETMPEYEYLVSNNPSATSEYVLTLKENLTSGTYKMVFKLYDNDTYMGEVYEYLIIK